MTPDVARPKQGFDRSVCHARRYLVSVLMQKLLSGMRSMTPRSS
jgi:hypothetical protein